jgi:hypothetical protein
VPVTPVTPAATRTPETCGTHCTPTALPTPLKATRTPRP